MKRTMYIRRKGFNYYTAYTEKYLHDALSDYGYYLVREKEKSIFPVIVYISEQEKYMALQSSFLDMLAENELSHAGEVFSEAFKSEVIISPADEIISPPFIPYVFYFSDIHNAFEIPAFVTAGAPDPVQEMKSLMPITAGEPRVYSFVNYGGPGVGLDIFIYGAKDGCFEEFTVNRWGKKNQRITETLSFTTIEGGLLASLPEFIIPAGINRNSAVLRARKLESEKNQRGFYFRFIPGQYFDPENVRISFRPYGSEKEYLVDL